MGGDEKEPREERSDEAGKTGGEGPRVPLGNLRATVRMAPIVRLKPPSWDEMPTAPQTRRGGSNIHEEGDEVLDEALDEALDEVADEPEGVTVRRGRVSDAMTTRRPSHPPDQTTQRRSSRPPPDEPPVSVPRWDDESLPFADAQELAKQMDLVMSEAPVGDADDPLEDDWDDVTMPRPRPSPEGLPALQAPPRRVSTAAPQSADFPSVGQPAVVVSPVLVLGSDEPAPAPEWIEPPPAARAPEPPPPRSRTWVAWMLAVLLVGLVAAGVFALTR